MGGTPATDARIDDIAHDFPRQDVRQRRSAHATLPYFPPAVHCVVVDPGVGTDRDAIVVRAGDHALVGPTTASSCQSPVNWLKPRTTPRTHSRCTWAYDDPASTTFHGRDVFAPAAAAAHVAGVDPLTPLSNRPNGGLRYLRYPAPRRGAGATGEVLVVDDSGAVTNIPGEVLAGQSARWSRSTVLSPSPSSLAAVDRVSDSSPSAARERRTRR